MFILFCSAESFCCNSSFFKDIYSTCFFIYALLSVNCVKYDIYAYDACAKFSTASLRLFYSATFPVNPCCWAVLYWISFWIIYSLSKRKRNSLKVFCIAGRRIHYQYSNRYFQVDIIKVSSAFISCSAVNNFPPSIAKRWHSSICLKIGTVGRCEAMGVVRRVVFTCNYAGLIRPYDWYKCKNIYLSDLTPKPNTAEWIPAK